MPTRRVFLQQSVLASAGAFASMSHAAPPRYKIGLQLYTIRDAMARDVDGTLKQVAALGYQEVEQNGRVPYDVVLKDTDPKLVKLQLDLYWLSHDSTKPPRYWFERAPGRYVMWHVKDMHKVSRDYTELGNGTIDYTKIWPDAAYSGMQHFFVEQGGNFATNSMQSITDGAAYVKRFLLPSGK